jgi:dienelactone hydrolase
VTETREITYYIDGLTMTAHLALPSGKGPWPAVLIGHDGIGLEEYQRGRADQLAERGYVALAMDYHAGRTYFGDPEAMLARVMPLLADPDRMRAVGRAALDLLLATPGVDSSRLGALGYGAGGTIVLELAKHGAPFKALAAVHPGLSPARPEDWTKATGTFLLCTGSADPICTPEQVLSFGTTLQAAGIDWLAHLYGGAQHAFWAAPRDADGKLTGKATHTGATVPGVGHHPAQEARAWRGVLDLFDETIGRADDDTSKWLAGPPPLA